MGAPVSMLTTRAPHKVLVQNYTHTVNQRGLTSKTADGDPVEVRCMCEPVREWSAAEETDTVGLQVRDLLVIRAKTWPGDIHSIVTYDGSRYETVGAPQRLHAGLSKRTHHWRITCKWIEVV